MLRRWSRPFATVLVVVFKESQIQNSLSLACHMDASVHLLGLVAVESDTPLSRGNAAARDLRKVLSQHSARHNLTNQFHVSVSYDPWEDLRKHIRRLKPDLVVLDWEAFVIHSTKTETLKSFPANLAILRGRIPDKINRTFIPLRGGPHAPLALRLALALPNREISAIHFDSASDSQADTPAPFKGLERILPSLEEVQYERRQSANPIQEIRALASKADLLVLGANLSASSSGPLVGQVAEDLLKTNPGPMLLVKSMRPEPRSYTGPEAERSGGGAISILVDKWFAEKTFHSSEFDHLAELVKRKQAQNLTVSLAIPALNEEETVGQVLSMVQTHLIEKYPLVDELVLIDSNSSDHTRQIAQDLGVPVHIHQELLPAYGARSGKGEALWKSLFVTHGDILLWIDSDIVNIHPRFVYGVLGPLLLDPEIQFVKGFYQRPLTAGRKVTPAAGGRVTELTARPLLNLFYPELSGVIQPLSGEYGGRRSALEQMTFYSGYGVETGLLIDAYEKYGLQAIAQVDLLERIHHNQSLQALSKMSFVIIQTVLSKLEKRFQRPLLEEINKSMKLIEYHNGSYYLDVKEIVEQERPPAISLPEYSQHMQKEIAPSVEAK
jgi:nucleotide-binding universal stress UspA family protein